MINLFEIFDEVSQRLQQSLQFADSNMRPL